MSKCTLCKHCGREAFDKEMAEILATPPTEWSFLKLEPMKDVAEEQEKKG